MQGIFKEVQTRLERKGKVCRSCINISVQMYSKCVLCFFLDRCSRIRTLSLCIDFRSTYFVRKIYPVFNITGSFFLLKKIHAVGCGLVPDSCLLRTEYPSVDHLDRGFADPLLKSPYLGRSCGLWPTIHRCSPLEWPDQR